MKSEHSFVGKWITDAEFSELKPRNVFHRQCEPLALSEEHLNAHVLFRREVVLDNLTRPATMYISADDYYKLYINGEFVTQGPALCYHFHHGYNVVDVTKYLHKGRNVIAVHTLYHGLINRVWQSGDFRHGLIYDLCIGDSTVASSDTNTLTARHTAYGICGRVGYDTQFLENYDSRAAECNFYLRDFDDSSWTPALPVLYDDHILTEQTTKSLAFDRIEPRSVRSLDGGRRVVYDFGENYVGYLVLLATGKSGDVITVRCAAELDGEGMPRYALRANCTYVEDFILGEGESLLDWFDYKAFRYAELLIPEGVTLGEVYLYARHYPFELKVKMKKEYEGDPAIEKVWRLAVNSQKFGAQEAILDCMEREKGFYVGDGCYTVLAHTILTGEDAIARKMIDDAFRSTFIVDTMVTCLGCSFMQEIAEYPLMLVYFILWHYRLHGDREYLASNYKKAVRLVDAYRRDYERELLITNLDKWCVVEWPNNYRDGYDVDITEGKICTIPHISINAYYIEAVHTLNLIARELGLPDYRDEKPLRDKFNESFYLKEKGLYRDSVATDHVSLIGNIFAYAFALSDCEVFYENMEKMIEERGIHSVSMFTSFPMMQGLVRRGKYELLYRQLTDPEAWLRIIREDSYTSFEGWGRDCKWNTSLFHMTMSDVAVFLADIDTDALFRY